MAQLYTIVLYKSHGEGKPMEHTQEEKDMPSIIPSFNAGFDLEERRTQKHIIKTERGSCLVGKKLNCFQV